MMVGDGFNDAAALAVAGVGVAVGTGESVNLEAADILIPGDDPRMLTEMVTCTPSSTNADAKFVFLCGHHHHARFRRRSAMVRSAVGRRFDSRSFGHSRHPQRSEIGSKRQSIPLLKETMQHDRF